MVFVSVYGLLKLDFGLGVHRLDFIVHWVLGQIWGGRFVRNFICGTILQILKFVLSTSASSISGDARVIGDS